MTADQTDAPEDLLGRADACYHDAVFGGEPGELVGADRALDQVEARLAVLRGKVVHARFLADRVADPEELRLFERAVALYRALGDERGEGEALFWAGCYHQVVQGEGGAALPLLERARELAHRTGDRLTLSYAVRHLGFAAYDAGDADTAAALQRESIRLREEIGFTAGAAAGKAALAYLEARAGRPAQAEQLLAEAATEAAAVDAKGVLGWVEQTRAELAGGQ
ncbi:tetratricopeptide repeat protein [Kitasatospora sp. NPDC058965]|uniref:tetratricopeptide repeat protein n=1 Tax=Kitasatospora sp. NPDC058965 TaxID=3346682 RepID=UPI0036C329B2